MIEKRESLGGIKGFQNLKQDKNYTKDSRDIRDLFSYNYIKMLRRYNYSTADVCRKVDSHPATVTRWRRGGMPNSEMMEYVCLLFNCDYIDFFRRD